MCTYIYLIHNIYGKKDPGTSFSRGERQKNQMSRDFQIAIMRHNMGLSHNNILTDNFLLSWLLLFLSFSWPYCSAFIFLMASSYSSLYHIYILYVFSSIICRYMCLYSIPYFLHFRWFFKKKNNILFCDKHPCCQILGSSIIVFFYWGWEEMLRTRILGSSIMNVNT